MSVLTETILYKYKTNGNVNLEIDINSEMKKNCTYSSLSNHISVELTTPHPNMSTNPSDMTIALVLNSEVYISFRLINDDIN